MEENAIQTTGQRLIYAAHLVDRGPTLSARYAMQASKYLSVTVHVRVEASPLKKQLDKTQTTVRIASDGRNLEVAARISDETAGEFAGYISELRRCRYPNRCDRTLRGVLKNGVSGMSSARMYVGMLRMIAVFTRPGNTQFTAMAVPCH